MHLTHKVRTTAAHFGHLPTGSKIVLGVANPEGLSEKVKQVGLSYPLTIGETLLPAARFGPNAKVNAEGWIEIHRNRPMETAYRTVLHHWRMKRGYGYEEDSKLVDISYRRYPRTRHKPFGMELSVAKNSAGKILLTLPPLTLGTSSDRQIITAVNLLIEAFGECDVMTENLDSIFTGEIKRLNWELLPQGRMPWKALEEKLQPILSQRKPKVREVVMHRFEVLNDYQPEFRAKGLNGFNGYVVFGFPKYGFFILESIYSGNATYGLGKNWEQLSKLTKGDLLENSLHKFRIIHSSMWEGEIKMLFNASPITDLENAVVEKGVS